MLLRSLLLLLVCMNLGVALWWATHAETRPAPSAAMEKGVASLTLLSEMERRSPDEAAELSTAPEEADPNQVCLSIGPFETQSALRRAMNSLLPRVERIQFREVAAVALRGYRVFLPAAGSRAQALETARALAAKGVSDYYVVTAGDEQNTVSLGIYHGLDNASKRHDAVAALGYNPTVEARTEPVSQWWIDLAADPGFAWRSVLTDVKLQAQAAPCT